MQIFLKLAYYSFQANDFDDTKFRGLILQKISKPGVDKKIMKYELR